MARKGLPRKYAKMGFKRGWRAYKAQRNRRKGRSGRKVSARKPRTRTVYRTRTVTARPKRKTYARKTAPKKRRSSRRRSRSMGFLNPRKMTPAQIQRTAIGVGAGVGGAVASAMAVRALPLSANWRGVSQLVIGGALMIMLPRKYTLAKVAAGGAAVAGALSVVKTNFPQVPLMAGEGQSGCMGVNYYPRTMGRAGTARSSWAERRQKYITAQPRPTSQMGINRNYSTMPAMSGARSFVTPADL